MTKDKRKPPERDADRVRGAAEPVESAPPEQQAKDDSHQLEDLYPEPSALLSSFSVPAVTSESVVVALDTSVLLVPYDMRASTSIDELKKAYEALAHGGRLFLPARSLREFVSRRDSAIGNAIDAMIKQKDRFPKGGGMPAVVASLEGFEGVKEISGTQEKYARAITKIIKAMKAWRGNDPVTVLYSQLFTAKNIVDLPNDTEARKTQLQEHIRRVRRRVPPGYKDQQKQDGGIGDFLIWKSILEIGGRTKKHMAFVTGEEKSDWFSRTAGQTLYPRYSLVDEYRRASGGRSLRLMSLHELLEEVEAPRNVVEDVKSAEESVERQKAAPVLGGLALANTSSNVVASSLALPPHSLTIVSSTGPTGPTGPGTASIAGALDVAALASGSIGAGPLGLIPLAGGSIGGLGLGPLASGTIGVGPTGTGPGPSVEVFSFSTSPLRAPKPDDDGL